MALRFMECDKEELAVRLVKTGLMSKMALKELLDKAEEKGIFLLSGGCAAAYDTDCFSGKYESVCALCHFDGLHIMPECGRI